MGIIIYHVYSRERGYSCVQNHRSMCPSYSLSPRKHRLFSLNVESNNISISYLGVKSIAGDFEPQN